MYVYVYNQRRFKSLSLNDLNIEHLLQATSLKLTFIFNYFFVVVIVININHTLIVLIILHYNVKDFLLILTQAIFILTQNLLFRVIQRFNERQ